MMGGGLVRINVRIKKAFDKKVIIPGFIYAMPRRIGQHWTSLVLDWRNEEKPLLIHADSLGGDLSSEEKEFWRQHFRNGKKPFWGTVSDSTKLSIRDIALGIQDDVVRCGDWTVLSTTVVVDQLSKGKAVSRESILKSLHVELGSDNKKKVNAVMQADIYWRHSQMRKYFDVISSQGELLDLPCMRHLFDSMRSFCGASPALARESVILLSELGLGVLGSIGITDKHYSFMQEVVEVPGYSATPMEIFQNGDLFGKFLNDHHRVISAICSADFGKAWPKMVCASGFNDIDDLMSQAEAHIGFALSYLLKDHGCFRSILSKYRLLKLRYVQSKSGGRPSAFDEFCLAQTSATALSEKAEEQFGKRRTPQRDEHKSLEDAYYELGALTGSTTGLTIGKKIETIERLTLDSCQYMAELETLFMTMNGEINRAFEQLFADGDRALPVRVDQGGAAAELLGAGLGPAPAAGGSKPRGASSELLGATADGFVPGGAPAEMEGVAASSSGPRVAAELLGAESTPAAGDKVTLDPKFVDGATAEGAMFGGTPAEVARPEVAPAEMEGATAGGPNLCEHSVLNKSNDEGLGAGIDHRTGSTRSTESEKSVDSGLGLVTINGLN